MRSADLASAGGRTMRRAGAALLLLMLGVGPLVMGACADGFSPLAVTAAPDDLKASAVRADAIRLTWSPSADQKVVSYVIERRVGLLGGFLEVAQVEQSPLEELVWLDTDVLPETVYGYRVRAVTSTGDRSGPSIVGGALTPPLPGIEITMTSLVTVAAAFDPDGYEIEIAGPDTIRATIGLQTKQRFSPLRPGQYTVRLGGLVSRCSVGQATQSVLVSDTVAATIVPVAFQVSCRDPERGTLLTAIDFTGADLDPSVTIDVLGEAADASLPPAERTYSGRRVLSPGVGSSTTFSDLRPGTYDVTLSDLAPNCVLQGANTRTIGVVRDGAAAVRFAVNCVGTAPPIDSTRPFILRNRFAPAAAPTASNVVLVSELDLTARAGFSVAGIQTDYFYDAAVLRFDSANVARLPQLTVNGNTPGVVSVLAASTTPRTGVVKLLELAFTVIGASGQSSASTTQNFKASSRIGSTTVAFGDSVRIEEDTFTVGSGAGVNAPPVAQAGGPYAGTVGAAVALTAAGSTDSDGTIVAYAWTFGDGTTGSGATTSKTYAAAGTYTVTLTVTDDDGATATDQATVTVTGSGGGNTPPVAQANGPYTATAGIPISLSSAGSSDANGTIVTYSWSLGNGQTASGPAPSVTYATAGTYTITLTVTDNGGLTASDQATVTVSTGGGTGGNLVWNSAFGAYDAGNNWVPLTISLNLTTNIAETPGTEAVRTYVIDSLKWDPTRFQLVSVNLGPGVSGAVGQSGASLGRLTFAGSVATANQSGDIFGVLTFATIRLRPVGPAASVGTTQTFLGPIQGPASTNFFIYNPRITVVEGAFTLP